jgi:hypothetical protein
MSQQPPSNLHALGWLSAAIVAWIVAMLVARRVLDRPPAGVALRVLVVAAAVACFLACVVAMVRLIRSQDEFSRRVHVVAAAVAFAAAITALLAGDLLQSAGLLGYVPLDALWMLMIVVWWLSMVAVSRYYR